MKTIDQTPTNRDLDRLLSDFYKSELPDPFPPLKLPARAELPMPVVAKEPARERRANSIRAKLSLAVSVALLIGGCWYLSGRISGAPEQAKIGNGVGTDNAKMPKEIKKGMRP
jgi:hypothetical protein